MATFGQNARLVASLEAGVTLADSTTATGIGAVTIPVGSLDDGAVIVIEAAGVISTTGTPNLTIRVINGTTALISSGAVATGSGLASVPFFIRAVGVVRTRGSAGTILWSLNAMIQEAATAQNTYSAVDTTADTVDQTAALTLDIDYTWGTASASNTLTTSQRNLWVFQG